MAAILCIFRWLIGSQCSCLLCKVCVPLTVTERTTVAARVFCASSVVLVLLTTRAAILLHIHYHSAGHSIISNPFARSDVLIAASPPTHTDHPSSSVADVGGPALQWCVL